jgi:hypothetical protein
MDQVVGQALALARRLLADRIRAPLSAETAVQGSA